MIHRMVFTDHLPTLALVALGASESVVGLQRTLASLAVLLQLLTLRAVGRVSKRSILVSGQILAVLGSLPLAFFAALEARSGNLGAGIALASFAVAAAGFCVSETVWFPMLHGFVERHSIGRFFGILRTGWHLTLILYFVAAQRWLAAHPGSFGPLFALGIGLGILRIVLIARLPERSERTGTAIRVREALGLVRSHPMLRRYLAGIVMGGAAHTVFATFAIVMMRRVVGFSEAQVLYTTVAVYTGGLVSLYLWGRVVDRVGAEPVFRFTALGQAALMLGFLFVRELDGATVALATGIFFGIWVLSSGFGVADTHVLFKMTPEETPARLLVPVSVIGSVLRGAAPLVAGIALDRALTAQLDPVWVYRTLFIGAAALQACAFLPLRVFK